jgi:hypothetical protein
MQAVCGRNRSNDGRNAAGIASVRRPCRHTAHALATIYVEHTPPKSVRARIAPVVAVIAEGDTFASVSEQHIKKTERFFTHSSKSTSVRARIAPGVGVGVSSWSE